MRPLSTANLTTLRIDEAAAALRLAGAIDVESYELKLRQNAGNERQVTNHLSEARVALMFLAHEARVTMRDSPDLGIEWLGSMFYAEVKHIKRKKQDEIDEAAERNARSLFVKTGDTYPLEGRYPYQQISDVARRKKKQYIDGAFNILVIDSRSESMVPAAPMALSGVNEFHDEVLKAPDDNALRRLHGIMLITDWGAVAEGFHNVGFAPTKAPLNRMDFKLKMALDTIGKG